MRIRLQFFRETFEVPDLGMLPDLLRKRHRERVAAFWLLDEGDFPRIGLFIDDDAAVVCDASGKLLTGAGTEDEPLRSFELENHDEGWFPTSSVVPSEMAISTFISLAAEYANEQPWVDYEA